MNLFTSTFGAGGGGGAPVGAHLYWRIRILEGYTGLVTVAEIDMLSSGVSQIGGGTAFASASSYGSVPANAFDGNTATWWGHSTAVGTTVGYQFSAAVSIDQVSITSRSGGDGGQCFKHGIVEYSDDGVSYTSAFPIFNGATAYGPTETRDFYDNYVQGSAEYWRILIATTFTGGIIIGEVEMRESVGGADVTSGETFSASSTFGGNVAGNAYDDSAVTYWQANGPANFVQWTRVQFASAKTIEQIALQAPTTNNQYMPRTGVIQRSSDGSTWDNAWWFEDQGASYATSETRAFARAA